MNYELLIKRKVHRLHDMTYWVMDVQIHSFLTSVLDRVEGQLHAPAVLLTRRAMPVAIEQEAGWVPQPVCSVFLGSVI
jgi:hypothetical protein